MPLPVIHRARQHRRPARRGARHHRPVQRPAARPARRRSGSSSATCARRAACPSSPRSPARTSCARPRAGCSGCAARREPRARPRLRRGQGAAVLLPAAGRRRSDPRGRDGQHRRSRLLRRRWRRGAASCAHRHRLRRPTRGVLLSLGPPSEKYAFLEEARALSAELGLALYATEGTAEMLQTKASPARALAKRPARAAAAWM